MAKEAFSFKVTVVASGEAAIGLLEKQKDPFELVLMDWKMPGMDGLETSRIIKEEKNIITPMIMMITSFGREEVAKKEEKIEEIIKPFGLANDHYDKHIGLVISYVQSALDVHDATLEIISTEEKTIITLVF